MADGALESSVEPALRGQSRAASTGLDRDLSAALRTIGCGDAAGLPFRLGLSTRGDARWSDFVQLPPNRDLPSWVCEGTDLSPARVREFDRAHHIAAGWGLVADRMDDQQVERPELFSSVRDGLLEAWRASLSRACGSPKLAATMIDAALEGWREGTEMERGFFEQRAGVDGIGAYVRSIRQRLGWISTSAVTMLMTTDRPSRAQVLRQAYGTFLCGLQCRDDAWDADEDRVTRGASVHEALGLPRGALTRAAPRALGTAAEEADRGGFSRLAAWVRSYCAEVAAATREPLTMVGAVGAMMIGEGVCRLDDAIEVPRVSVNPSATSRNNQRGGAPWR